MSWTPSSSRIGKQRAAAAVAPSLEGPPHEYLPQARRPGWPPRPSSSPSSDTACCPRPRPAPALRAPDDAYAHIPQHAAAVRTRCPPPRWSPRRGSLSDGCPSSIRVSRSWRTFRRGGSGIPRSRPSPAPRRRRRSVLIAFTVTDGLFSDPCHWDLDGTGSSTQPGDVEVGPTVNDLVAALQANSSYTASDATPIIAGDHAGQMLELQLPGDDVIRTLRPRDRASGRRLLRVPERASTPRVRTAAGGCGSVDVDGTSSITMLSIAEGRPRPTRGRRRPSWSRSRSRHEPVDLSRPTPAECPTAAGTTGGGSIPWPNRRRAAAPPRGCRAAPARSRSPRRAP